MLYSIADTVTPVRAARQFRNLVKIRNNINLPQSTHSSTQAMQSTHGSVGEMRTTRGSVGEMRTTHASVAEMIATRHNEGSERSLDVTPSEWHTQRSVDILS